MEMKITSITFTKKFTDVNKLKATLNIVLNDCLCLTDIRIYHGVQGYFVSYPFDGSSRVARQVFYPITKEFRDYCEETIIAEYRKQCEDAIINEYMKKA